MNETMNGHTIWHRCMKCRKACDLKEAPVAISKCCGASAEIVVSKEG